MQVKPIPAPATAGSSAPLAGLFKPLRLNFAQVCLYCGTRWCESPECVRMHAESLWAPCPTCDGFAGLVNCRDCVHGVVEVDRAGLAALASRVLPTTVPDAGEYAVTEVADTPTVDLSTIRDTATGLTYGEIAYCIAVSDMPTERPKGTTEDPAAFIAQGLARLGRAELGRRVADSHRLAGLTRQAASKAERRAATAAHRQLWGGAARFGRAHRLAERYWRTAAR